jgi:hypothetical protein
MSHAITFDTLRFAKTLESKGFRAEQAEAMSAALNDIFQSVEQGLATKADLKEEIARFEGKIDTTTARLEGKIETVKFDLLKWYIGGAVAQVVAIMFLIARFFGKA